MFVFLVEIVEQVIHSIVWQILAPKVDYYFSIVIQAVGTLNSSSNLYSISSAKYARPREVWSVDEMMGYKNLEISHLINQTSAAKARETAYDATGSMQDLK